MPGSYLMSGEDIRLDANGGIEVAGSSLRVKLPTSGGLSRGGGGLAIAAFTGFLAKDHNVGAITYPVGYTTLLSIDAGPDAIVFPVRWETPLALGNVRPVVSVVFHDTSEYLDENISLISSLLRTQQDISDLLLGGALSSAARNGMAIRKIEFRARNVGVASEDQDLGTFRIRGLVLPRGTGSAL